MNKKLILLVIIVVVVILVGVWLILRFVNPAAVGPSEFSAVYLTSGDIYFGKLSWFPSPRLTNVWLLQRGVDAANQPQLGVVPFTTAFWGPTDEIRLNPEQILFTARLRADSQLARAFANPAAIQPPAPPSPAGPPPAQ